MQRFVLLSATRPSLIKKGWTAKFEIINIKHKAFMARTKLQTQSLGFIALFILAHFSHHLLTALIVPLLPFIRNSFELNYTQSGLLVSAFTIAYGTGQLPAGWFGHRIGARLLIAVGIIGVGAAAALVGLSRSFPALILFLVLMGLAGGGYHPSASQLISSSVEPKMHGRAFGLHIIGGGASYFLAPLIGVVICSFWSWRGAFIGLAAPVVLFGALIYLILVKARKITLRERYRNIPGSEESSPKVHFPKIIAFLILTTCISAFVASAIAFVPLFMVDQFNLSEKTAAAMLAIIYSTAFWAAPLGGYLADRLGRLRVLVAIGLSGGPVIFLINLIPYGFGFAVLLLLIGALMFIRMPASEAHIVNTIPLRLRSRVLGIYFFAGIEGGAILTPIMGFLIDQRGFYYSFMAAGAGLLGVALVCSLMLLRSEYRTKRLK